MQSYGTRIEEEMPHRILFLTCGKEKVREGGTRPPPNINQLTLTSGVDIYQ